MSKSFEKTDPDLISTNLNPEIEAIFEKMDNLLALDAATCLSPLTLKSEKSLKAQNLLLYPQPPLTRPAIFYKLTRIR